MRRYLLPVLCAAAAAALPAQRTLQQLQEQFVGEARALGEASSRDQRDALLDRQIAQLRQFVAGEAKGDDRWNGHLMLADLCLARGDRKAAAAALRGLDAAQAPALVLGTAAAMAQHLNLKAERDAWVAAATGKAAPLADRLALARLLLTVLTEVERGEALFQKALAEAGDDEQRALVRWHRADAMRDREDLPENAGFEELEKLAKDLPGTYWGSVAKDRLRATRLSPGDDPIPSRATTRDGKTVDLAEQRGKAVVLVFWSQSDRDTKVLCEQLAGLQKQHGAQLVVLGICLDREAAAAGAAVSALGMTFPTVADGKGIETDLALRWFVEGPTVHVIDSRGKVAALGLHAGTADARAELQAAVARAVQP